MTRKNELLRELAREIHIGHNRFLAEFDIDPTSDEAERILSAIMDSVESGLTMYVYDVGYSP